MVAYQVTTNVSIKTPFVIYYNSTSDWNSLHALNFWDKNNTNLSIKFSKVDKTIYDPSPVDFSIITSGALYFVQNGATYTSDYAYVNTGTGGTYKIPFMGLRLGNISYYKDYSWFPSSTPQSETKYWGIGLSHSSIGIESTWNFKNVATCLLISK